MAFVVGRSPTAKPFRNYRASSERRGLLSVTRGVPDELARKLRDLAHPGAKNVARSVPGSGECEACSLPGYEVSTKVQRLRCVMRQNNSLPEIFSCASCGVKPETLETCRPEGRQRDLYRVACACGQASPRWSVSESAAVRLWNETMAGEKKKDAS